MARAFNTTMGVDLGGGRGKSTAIAVLRHEGEQATVVELAPRRGAPPLYDAALVQHLREQQGDVLLAIDAPLTLPPCLRCTLPLCPSPTACVDPAVVAMRHLVDSAPGQTETRDTRRGKPTLTPYTQRATELHLSVVRRLATREGLGQGTGPLAARAAFLMRTLADRFTLDRNLIEVYPRGTLASLGFERPFKKHHREQETRAEILESLSEQLAFAPGVWRELCVQSDHLFEAVICAFTGFLWSRDEWQRPQDGTGAADGWIWVPPATVSAEALPVPEEESRRAYARSAGSS